MSDIPYFKAGDQCSRMVLQLVGWVFLQAGMIDIRNGRFYIEELLFVVLVVTRIGFARHLENLGCVFYIVSWFSHTILHKNDDDACWVEYP